MMGLLEYRRVQAQLADYLPWAGVVAPSVVLNKDGAFQRTARFRGPDLDSATESELVAVTARLNNALKRLGSGDLDVSDVRGNLRVSSVGSGSVHHRGVAGRIDIPQED